METTALVRHAGKHRPMDTHSGHNGRRRQGRVKWSERMAPLQTMLPTAHELRSPTPKHAKDV